MTFDEFINLTGIKTSKVCEILGITRSTFMRIKRGSRVRKDLAQKINLLTQGRVNVEIFNSRWDL
jgi:hypothetical protein